MEASPTVTEFQGNSYIITSYVVTIIAVTAFAAFALIYTRFYSKKNETTEDFITGGRSHNKYRIAWSFFAGAVGAWVIVSPASYACFAGVLGLVFYSVSAGIPLMVAALFGEKIQKALPNCCSLADFIGYRFGPVAKIFVILLCLFNMSIAMLAEYTTIGSLFKDFVGSLNYPIIIVVGVLTLIYTAYGGLSVSIVTDQLQGALSITLITLLTSYVAATFREPLPPNFGDYNAVLGPNEYGYSAIFVMPVSLMAATVFSEAIWQRVWASESKDALRFGAFVGGIGVIITVFLAGFAGVLGLWGGLINVDYTDPDNMTNPNLYMFQIFKAQSGRSTVSSWVGVVTLVLAITMNESALDSLQNGIAATLSSHFFKSKAVAYARVTVLLINIPLVAVATQNYNVLSLFLITNMLCSCWFVPVCLGLWDTSTGRRLVTESGVVLSGALAMLATTAYGIGRIAAGAIPFAIAQRYTNMETYELEMPSPLGTSLTVSLGAEAAWYSNGYAWDYFLVSTGSSVVALALVSGASLALQSLGLDLPGVSDLAAKLPGFKYLASAESVPSGKAAAYEGDNDIAIKEDAGAAAAGVRV